MNLPSEIARRFFFIGRASAVSKNPISLKFEEKSI